MDCGIYMIADFAAHSLGQVLKWSDGSPRGIRSFLARAHATTMTPSAFWQPMKSLLAGKPDSSMDKELLGAGFEFFSPQHSQHLIDEAKKHSVEVDNRNLCYMSAATALAARAQGRNMALTSGALANRATRAGFAAGIQGDTSEALTKAFGLQVTQLRLANRQLTTALVIGPSDIAQPFKILCAPLNAKKRPGKGLPATHEDLGFVLGATYNGTSTTQGAGLSGHYKLTADPKQATIGVYEAQQSVRIAPGRQKATLKAPSHHMVPLPDRLTSDDDPARDTMRMEDVLREVLDDTKTLRLNASSGRRRGYAPPRTWIVYPRQPRHINNLAWSRLSPQTRRVHISLLTQVQCMPHDLIEVNIATAVIHLLCRQALAGGWKASTLATKFAAMESALPDLPIYTN